MSTRKRKVNASSTSRTAENVGPSQIRHHPRPQTTSSTRTAFIAIILVLIVGAVYYYTRSTGYKNDEEAAALSSAEERDASIFFVQDIPGKGKGVIAARDIEPGELIIYEKPLFIVPLKISVSPSSLIYSNLQRIDVHDREAFFNLSYVNLPPNVDPEEDTAEVALAIFQTNAVAAGDGVGIFPRMARLNHGCSSAFNVVYTWREGEAALVVHALKGVKEGQELLTTYSTMKKPRAERRAYLREHYGFECQCHVCSLSDTESKASDGRLVAISDLYGRFGTWGQGSINGKEAIDIVKRIWVLGDEEGYYSERGQLAADAAWVAAAHWDATATREWAQVALQWFIYEVGSDSEQAESMRVLMVDPERHHSWGTRKKMYTIGRPDY
ncbi:SET domain-containing protein [Marasmius fiardii PR-910]|nr:SET domain-containing protein [Marasmius fiardii PR-910]